MRLVWKSRALRQVETAAEWSPKQARAVVEAMEQMARSGWSLGRPVGNGRRYIPVRPLGVFYRVIGDALVVVSVVDARRLRVLPKGAPGLSAAGGAVRGGPRLTSTVHLDMVADRASR